MTKDYAYDHGWAKERIRLAGLETALDPGTRSHMTRLGVGPGTRCLEIGAGGGSVAFWLSEQVAPNGTVVATDLETDFLESEASGRPCLEVLRHDIMANALPAASTLSTRVGSSSGCPTSAWPSSEWQPRFVPAA